MSDTSRNAALEEILARVTAEAVGRDVLVSGFVIIVEAIGTEDGRHELVTVTDGHTPPWSSYGMIQWAAEQLSQDNGEDD